MDVSAWEVAFVLLLLAVILGVGRLVQLSSAMRRSANGTRTVVRQEPVAPAPPPPPPVPPVICAACQATNVGTNKFCSVCGASLVAQAATPTLAVSEALSAAAGDTPTVLEGGPPAVASAGTTIPTNTCPSCATVNPPGQPFCGQCGTQLGTAAA